jgi:histidinol phosphatase-like PHP family hydrolase
MRIDLHTHTLLSDGELLPMELARRAFVKGHSAIAFTDHVALSTLERVLREAKLDIELAESWGMQVLLGVEITHVPAAKMDRVIAEARRQGAEIIVVHGETISEPVEKGTNLAAVSNPEVDILAHPGFITEEEAELAKSNGVHLEITSRASHCKTNGHVALVARKVGARMVVNTDAHSPSDLIDTPTAFMIAQGAGLSRKEAEEAVLVNPAALVKKRRG